MIASKIGKDTNFDILNLKILIGEEIVNGLIIFELCYTNCKNFSR